MMVAYSLHAAFLLVHSVSAACEMNMKNCKSSVSFEANLMVQHTAFVTLSQKRAPKATPKAKESTQVAPKTLKWRMKTPATVNSDAVNIGKLVSDDVEAGGEARGTVDDDSNDVPAPAPRNKAKVKAVASIFSQKRKAAINTQVAPKASKWTTTKVPATVGSDADNSDDIASDVGEAGGEARGTDDDDSSDVPASAPKGKAKVKAAAGAQLHWNQKIAVWLRDMAPFIMLCILGAFASMSLPFIIVQQFNLAHEGQKLASVQAQNSHPLNEAAATKWTTALLPIMWPKLVNATATSQLLLPAEKFDDAAWCLDLFDSMGFAILCVSSRNAAKGDRVVEAWSRGDGATLLATVSSFLELRGTNGNWLGRFDIGINGTCLLREASGCPMVSVQHDGNGIQFHIASLPDGERLATATRSEGSLVLPLKHFEITVAPGVDVVLVLMCLLSSILFRPQASMIVKPDGET